MIIRTPPWQRQQGDLQIDLIGVNAQLNRLGPWAQALTVSQQPLRLSADRRSSWPGSHSSSAPKRTLCRRRCPAGQRAVVAEAPRRKLAWSRLLVARAESAQDPHGLASPRPCASGLPRNEIENGGVRLARPRISSSFRGLGHSGRRRQGAERAAPAGGGRGPSARKRARSGPCALDVMASR